MQKKIRIFLQSFDYQILDESCKILKTEILKTEIKQNIKGAIPFPTRRRIYCVLRSPHVNKDSREQFEIRRYKRILDIYPKSGQDPTDFLQVNLPAGVSIKFVLD